MSTKETAHNDPAYMERIVGLVEDEANLLNYIVARLKLIEKALTLLLDDLPDRDTPNAPADDKTLQAAAGTPTRRKRPLQRAVDQRRGVVIPFVNRPDGAA